MIMNDLQSRFQCHGGLCAIDVSCAQFTRDLFAIAKFIAVTEHEQGAGATGLFQCCPRRQYFDDVWFDNVKTLTFIAQSGSEMTKHAPRPQQSSSGTASQAQHEQQKQPTYMYYFYLFIYYFVYNLFFCAGEYKTLYTSLRIAKILTL